MIVTITSQKGGVGKTTTAVSIAHNLATRWDSTLLIDFDPQGHCAISLGMSPEPGIYRWLDPVFAEPVEHAVRITGRQNLRLLPGDSNTRRTEWIIRNETGAYAKTCNRILHDVRDQLFHHAVIDTPPGGVLQEIAVDVADFVVVPVRLETLALDGVAATLAMAKRLGKNANRIFILPVMQDKRLNEHKLNLEALHTHYGEAVCAPVPARVAVAEAVAEGRTVYEPDIPEVSSAYRRAIDDLFDRLEEIGHAQYAKPAA